MFNPLNIVIQKPKFQNAQLQSDEECREWDAEEFQDEADFENYHIWNIYTSNPMDEIIDEIEWEMYNKHESAHWCEVSDDIEEISEQLCPYCN